MAAEMAGAPGLDGLAAVVDELIGDPSNGDEPRPALAS
jgi:hypothetical protein